MSLLRNFLNLNGAKGASPRSVYNVITRVWTVLFVSSFFDPFLSTVVKPAISSEVGYSLAIGITCALLPSLHQPRWQHFVGYLRSLHRQSVSQKASLITSLMFGVVLIAATVKGAVFLSSTKGLIGALMVFIFIIALIQGLVRAIREQQRDQERFLRLPFHQIERWEQQMIILSLLPIVLARVVSILGVFSAVPTAVWWQRLPFFGVGIVLLILLQPDRQVFRGLCPRCKQPVPRVLVEMGSCFRCNERLRSPALEPTQPPR